MSINRFKPNEVKEWVKTKADEFLSNFTYNAEDIQGNGEKANMLASMIRDTIHNSGKLSKRYKLNVQCFLGEKRNHKVNIVAKGWWDPYLDNYVTYTFQGDYFYCTIIVWGFYTD